MCGKFTAMASWAQVVAWSEILDRFREQRLSNDQPVIYRVMSTLPVIIWDPVSHQRRVIPFRWGFPDAKDWHRPKPIHARSETVDTTKAFAHAFQTGQRGIVLMRTFNEAPDIEGPTIQHTITPGTEPALAAAFIWQRFELAEQTMAACVLCTAPANALLCALPTDRMPAFLDREAWSTWLGEDGNDADAAKACLKTAEGEGWTMAREEKSVRAARQKK
jgi:putative SOS response-associated peptidase YedK